MKHEEEAERLQRDAERLEEQGDRVERRIEETRGDWESKEGDASVPGAQPESGIVDPEEVDEEDEG